MKKKGLNKKDQAKVENTVPVLYQNIAGEVYAFAQVGKEVYFGKVPVSTSIRTDRLPRSIVEQFEKEVA